MFDTTFEFLWWHEAHQGFMGEKSELSHYYKNIMIKISLTIIICSLKLRMIMNIV